MGWRLMAFPVSNSFRQYVRAAHRPVQTIEWSLGRGMPWHLLKTSGGTVTCDYNATTRWALSSMEIKNPPDELDVLGCRLRIKRGIYIPGHGDELVPWGVYRINSISESYSGVTVDASSFEQQIADSVFLRPRRIAGGVPDDQAVVAYLVPGTTFRDIIDALVKEAVPGMIVEYRTNRMMDTIRSFVELEDRWGLLNGADADKSIASAMGVTMFCDGRGTFVIEDNATLKNGVDWRLDDVKYPVGIQEMSKTQDRDGLYNVVSVSGQTTDGNPPVGPVFAWDNYKYSRTYAGYDPVNDILAGDAADFGVVTKKVESSLVDRIDRASNSAYNHLMKVLGVKSQINFTQCGNAANEPGDILQNGNMRYILDSWQCSLEDEAMQCATRAAKNDLSDIAVRVAA